MALEKSKLIVEIEATGEKAPKVLANISQSIKDIEENQKSLAKTTSKSSEAIEKERKRYEDLAKILEKNNVNIKQLNQNMDHMNSMSGTNVKSTAKFNNEVLESAKNIQQLNRNILILEKQGGSSITKMSKSFTKISGAINEVTNLFNTLSSIVANVQRSFESFMRVIELLSDKEKMLRIAKLVRLLSYLAALKGYSKTSKQLRQLSDGLIEFSAQLENFREKIETSFNRAILLSKALEYALEGMKGVIILTGVAIASMTVSGLITGLQRATMETGKFINITKMIMPVLDAIDKGLIVVLTRLIAAKKFFGATSTVGAQQVGLLRKAFLELQFSLEVVFKNIKKVSGKGFDKFAWIAQRQINKVIGRFYALGELFKSGNLLEKGMSNLSGITASLSNVMRFLGESFKLLGKRILPAIPALVAMTGLLVDLFSVIYGGLPAFTLFMSFSDDLKINLTLVGKSFQFLGSTIEYYSKYALSILVNKLKIAKSVIIGFYESVLTGSKIISTASSSINNFSKAITAGSTAGAQQVGLLKRIFFELKYASEVATKSIVEFGTKLFSSIKPIVKSFSDSVKLIGLNFKNISMFAKEFAIGFMDGFIAPIRASGRIMQDIISILKSSLGSFKGFAGFMKTVFAPSIVTATKAGTALGPVVASLGLAALLSENGFIKLAGVITFVLAAAFITLGTIITLLLDHIGRLVEAIGDTLINAMRKFEKQAIKNETVLRAFEFTIKGFNRVLGVESIGSIEHWNDTVEKMGEVTSFSVDEVRKSIKLLIAEGSSLGLGLSDMDMLLQRSADIAASTGKELNDVIQRIVQGLQGQSQSVLALGMNLTEHALANSEFLKEQGKVISSLTEEEKIRLRLIEVFSQSAPVVGAAKDQLSTIAGATSQYNNALEQIQIALGEQSTATVAYTKALTALNKVFLELPKPLISLMGILIDLGGVFLKVIGIFMQYFLLIASVIHISMAFNTVLASGGLAANSIGKAFAWAAGKLAIYDSSVKASMLASSSLGAILSNTGNILKAGFIATIKEIIVIFESVRVKAIALTVAIVNNPLFAKGLGVVAALSAAYYILNLFREELDELLKVMPMWSKILVIVLSGIVAVNYALQVQFLRSIILNKNVRLLIASLKVQAVITYGSATAINVLSVSVSNLAAILMTKLRSAISTVVFWIGILNKAILLNPLFWAAVAIATGIASIAVAVSELNEDVKKLSKSSEENSKSIDVSTFKLSMWEAALLSIKDSIRAVWQIIVDFTKIAIVGWIIMMKKAHITWLKMKSVFQDVEGFKKIRKEIKGMEKEMKDLQGAGMIAFESLADNALGAKVAFAEVKDELRATGKAFDVLKNKAQLIDEAKIEVMGNEFEKAQFNLRKVTEEFDKLQSQLKKGMLLSGEQADKFEELFKKKTIEQFKLQKLISDNMTQFANEEQQTVIDRLRGQGKLVEAAQMEGDIRLKAFRDQANAMKHTGTMTDKQHVQVLNMYQSLRKVVGAQVELAKQAENIKLYGNLDEDIRKLNEQTSKLNDDINSNNKTVLRAIEERRKASLKEIDDLEEKLRLTGLLAGHEKELADAKKAVEGKAVVDISAEKKNLAGNVGQVLGDVGKYAADFGEMAGGAMGDVLGSVGSKLMALAGSTAAVIAGLILKLPSIFDMVSGLINEITSWPMKLSDAIRNFTLAIQSFLMDFPVSFLKLMDDIPDILFRFIEYLIDNLDIIAERWVKAIITFIPRLAQRLAEAFGKLVAKILINAFREMFALVGISIGDMFDEKTEKIADGISKGFKRAAQEAQDMGSELFNISDLKGAGAVAAERDNAIEAIKKVVNDSVNLLALWWSKFLSWLDAKWTELLQGLKDIWMWVWEKIVTPILEGFNKVIEAMGAAFQFLFDMVIVPLGKVIDSLIGGIKDFGPALMGFITGFTETFKTFGTSIWAGLKEGLEGATDIFIGIGGKIWDGLKGGIESISNGIVKVFNDLNPSNLFDKIFAVDYQGKGTVESTLGIDVPFMNFAKGTDAKGYLKGNAKVPGDSITNDTILSLLSPGEVVIPRSIAQNPMAQRVIDKLLRGELNNFYKVSVSTNGVSVSGSPSVPTPNVSVPSLNDIKKMSVQDVKDFVKKLDPTSLWGQVKEKVFKDMFWEMIRNNKFQNGGLVNGVGGTVDPGEFVITRQAARGFGIGGLNAINAGKGGGTTTNNYNIKFEINTTEKIDNNFIRNRIGPVFKDMIRKDSLNGKRIIEKTGVG